jgi:hypothetical protein
VYQLVLNVQQGSKDECFSNRMRSSTLQFMFSCFGYKSLVLGRPYTYFDNVEAEALHEIFTPHKISLNPSASVPLS